MIVGTEHRNTPGGDRQGSRIIPVGSRRPRSSYSVITRKPNTGTAAGSTGTYIFLTRPSSSNGLRKCCWKCKERTVKPESAWPVLINGFVDQKMTNNFDSPIRARYIYYAASGWQPSNYSTKTVDDSSRNRPFFVPPPEWDGSFLFFPATLKKGCIGPIVRYINQYVRYT